MTFKKIINIVFGLAVFFNMYGNISAVSAQEISDMPQIEEELYTEISQTISFFPQLNDSGIWLYTVELYNISDTNMLYNLADNSLYYDFPDTGKYILRYCLNYRLAEPDVYVGEYLSTILNVVDTEKPTIEIKGAGYSSRYKIGDVLNIVKAEIVDNCKFLPDYTIELYFKDRIIPIDRDEVTLKESGNYTVIYTATDRAGNIEKFTAEFVVIGEDSVDEVSLYVLIGGGVVFVVGVVALFIIKRKSKKAV